ncbi:DUF481 domain-containing protein [Chitinophagaceae bacterium LB-8]|uniref:DUF481 domain-containing protein n=1 Tax=Paraflavisolibacter caeni TaxID=2982496 RepID=A0A9X2XZJ1_9BACT|nr:DUF481 domain-containing protein [Paraflavisolibacter caeni]MCU7552296.1 DUF481 domain-containing protein [Paraflavisolibacter caeni]
MFRLWHMVLLLFIAVSLTLETNAQKKDTLLFFNGQVLIGDIKAGFLGKLTIDEVDLGIIQVKMYKIKTIQSSGRFKIETQDKRTYYGVMQPGPKNGWVNILQDNSEVFAVSILNLNTIIAIEKGFFPRLEGNLAAGFSYTKSNSLGQLNFSFNVKYAGERFGHQLSLATIGSLDSSKYSRDREDGSLFTSYDLNTSTWFLSIGLNYQRNLELSIASRFQEFFGGGNKIIVRKYWQLRLMSGLTINQERSTSGTSTNELFELPLIFRFNFFKYHSPNIQINTVQSFYYSLSQKGRVRFDNNINFSWELIRRFYLTFNPYSNFDNQPPEGDSNFDFGVAINISYRF